MHFQDGPIDEKLNISLTMLSPSHITRSLSSMSVPVLSPTSGLSSENIKTSQAGWQLFSTISNNMLDASISILEEWRGNDKVVNYRNKYSETPLHEASLYGRKKVASWIIAAGGDINARTKDNWTPLHVAALYNRTSIISLLVAAGANVDSKNDVSLFLTVEACVLIHLHSSIHVINGTLNVSHSIL
jgi:ankyrin repeat protein